MINPETTLVERLRTLDADYEPSHCAEAMAAAADEIERLRGLCLPEFEGEVACKLLRLFSPDADTDWVCHWWPSQEADPHKQTYGEGATIREAVANAIRAAKRLDDAT